MLTGCFANTQQAKVKSVIVIGLSTHFISYEEILHYPIGQTIINPSELYCLHDR